ESSSFCGFVESPENRTRGNAIGEMRDESFSPFTDYGREVSAEREMISEQIEMAVDTNRDDMDIDEILDRLDFSDRSEPSDVFNDLYDEYENGSGRRGDIDIAADPFDDSERSDLSDVFEELYQEYG
ncbi:hypothetical protein PFISCL1PPCAC_22092, partial [Pristionchus fissidentatus]